MVGGGGVVGAERRWFHRTRGRVREEEGRGRGGGKHTCIQKKVSESDIMQPILGVDTTNTAIAS